MARLGKRPGLAQSQPVDMRRTGKALEQLDSLSVFYVSIFCFFFFIKAHINSAYFVYGAYECQ